MYSVDYCPKGLVIGKQGENEAEKVAVDFSPWASEFGAGTISARLRRPKDSAAYPVALTTDDTTATWTVSATDTQYAGAGSLQLVYIVGDMVAKSVIWPVRVLPSLEEGEAPEPYESWLDTLEGLAADTQENARDAAQSAADASASAEDAAQSAQSAAESAASITGLTAVAETLPEGSEASASFDSATDTLTLGIPRGDTGATGPAGPAGPKGDTGEDGFSPSASVTKQDGNIVITVTDKDGTTSATLEVDDALDDTSENPVENRVIQNALWNMLPVGTASGAIASFPDGADDVPMLSLKAQIDPVQDLHGYDSPWPAGGGKNKLNISSDIVDKTTQGIDVKVNRDSDGNCISIVLNGTPSSRAYITLGNYDFKEGTILSGCPAGGATSTYSLAVDGTPIADRGNGYTITENVDNGNLMAVIGVGYTCNNLTFKPMVILASKTDTSFAPYSNICPISGHTGVNISHSGADITNPDVIPVSWETEAGTVYGGELDVVTGKLTVDRAMVDLGTLNWTYQSAQNRYYSSGIAALVKAPTSNSEKIKVLSSNYKYWSLNALGISDNEGCAISTTKNVYVKEYALDGMDAAAFKTAMNGVQLCYELAEPIEYTLTPQEVKTYLGQNNIWNDVGDTEVMYRADIQKFIEKKVTS